MDKFLKTNIDRKVDISELVNSDKSGFNKMDGGTSIINLFVDNDNNYYILKKMNISQLESPSEPTPELESEPSSTIVTSNQVLLYWSGEYIDGAELLKNEVKYLSVIDKYIYFPTLFYSNVNNCEIMMSFVGGNIIYEKNIPNDWKEQLLNIYNILKEYNIYHNDIFEGNICILENKISLIDFGQASSNIPGYPWFNLSLKLINETGTIYELCEKILNSGLAIIASLYIHTKLDKRVN